ncbi:glycosyltransferase [Cytophagaceae bacterium ABcell3]|nr:glycosyltransferase [Cytophagaceae bacterium ABcell3]
MHIGIFTIGSRGDVQPYIALALGLKAKGYTVTLGAPENLKGFVERYGINYHFISGNAEEVINSPEGLRLLRSGSSFSLLRFFAKQGRKLRHEIGAQLMDGCQKVDFVITSYISTFVIATIAEKLNKKWAIVNVNPPFVKTSERPILDMDFLNTPWYNRLTYKIYELFHWGINKKDIQEFRKSIDLPPLNIALPRKIHEDKILTISAISPILYKKPNDWEEQYLMTGFMSLPPEARKQNTSELASSALGTWLKAGPKPIYIGFGSIPFPKKEAFLETLTFLLNKTDYRIIFCPGWFRVGNLPEHPNLFIVDKINHDWLFPKCEAAVIHGGIGTLTAVLKAEIPPIVVSIFADQPFWGNEIEKKGLGAHIPSKELSPSRLQKALKFCQSSSAMKDNIADVGKKLKQEDGVAKTIEALEQYHLK